jgi:hypothetical protein
MGPENTASSNFKPPETYFRSHSREHQSGFYLTLLQILDWRIEARRLYPDLADREVSVPTQTSTEELQHYGPRAYQLLVSPTQWMSRDSVEAKYDQFTVCCGHIALLVRDEIVQWTQDYFGQDPNSELVRSCDEIYSRVITELHVRTFSYFSANVTDALSVQALSKKLDEQLLADILRFNNKLDASYDIDPHKPLSELTFGPPPTKPIGMEYGLALGDFIKDFIGDAERAGLLCETLRTLPGLMLKPRDYTVMYLIRDCLRRKALAAIGQCYPELYSRGAASPENIELPGFGKDACFLADIRRLSWHLKTWGSLIPEMALSRNLNEETCRLRELLVLRAVMSTHAFITAFDEPIYARERNWIDSMVHERFPHITFGAPPDANLSELDTIMESADVFSRLPPIYSANLNADERNCFQELLRNKAFAASLTWYSPYPEVLIHELKAYLKVRGLFKEYGILHESDRAWINERMAPVMKLSQFHAHEEWAVPFFQESRVPCSQSPLLWALDTCLYAPVALIKVLPLISKILTDVYQEHGCLPGEFTQVIYEFTRREVMMVVPNDPYPMIGTIEYSKKFGTVPYEDFHSSINQAFKRDHPLPEHLVLLEFWKMVAMYPEYVEDAQTAIAQVHGRIPIDEEHHQLRHGGAFHATYAVARLVEDAANQGKSLFEAEFLDLDLSPENRSFTCEELIERLRPPSSFAESEVLNQYQSWARECAYAHVWSTTLRYLFLRRGFTHDEFVEVHDALKSERFGPPSGSGLNGQILEWSCFSTSSSDVMLKFLNPSASVLLCSLKAVLPSRKSANPHEEISTFVLFSHIMKQLPKEVLIQSKVQTVAAFMRLTELRAKQDGRIDYLSERERNSRTLAIREFAMSGVTLGGHGYYDERFVYLYGDLATASAKFEQDISNFCTLLSQAPDILVDPCPYDILLLTLALRIRHIEFPGKRSIASVVESFHESYREGRVQPLQQEWQNRAFRRSFAQIKPIRESEIVEATRAHVESLSSKITAIDGYLEQLALYEQKSSSLTGYETRAQVLEMSAPPKPSAESARLLDSVEGQFLRELLTKGGYRDQLKFVESGNSRAQLLSMIEAIVDGINGGVKDEVESARSEENREHIRQALELDDLTAALREEYKGYQGSPYRPGKEREVMFTPTRGILSEFGGHICQTCLTRTDSIAERYPNAVFFAFTQNSKTAHGEESTKFVGGTFLLEVVGDDGEKFFIVRGFNPSKDLVKEIKCGELFEAFIDYISVVARERGISRIVVPADEWWGSSLTNRPFVSLYIKETYSDVQNRFDLPISERIEFNDIPISSVYTVRDLREY